ncbi:MAG TPA: ATP-binding protein, partial [Solirubrobacteraceae bacterium]|nr:ATP-binding protein [Solirubrobacteraceae bacterium]
MGPSSGPLPEFLLMVEHRRAPVRIPGLDFSCPQSGRMDTMLLRAPNRAPLLGRAVEMEVLTALLDGIEQRGAALLLHGEAGIGKSRLLFEAVQAARERGMRVLTATGVQSEAHLPFA